MMRNFAKPLWKRPLPPTKVKLAVQPPAAESQDPGMSTPLTLDRSYFQTLLASAYVVQQSRLEPDALSSFLEEQRSGRATSHGIDCRACPPGVSGRRDGDRPCR